MNQSKMAERNPSPPRLSQEERELIESDNIGDTVFSKKWVLKTLMKLLEKVNTESEENGGENEGESSANNEASEGQEAQNDNQNLDEEFDMELCELWDMSMNQDVAVLLHEVDSTDVLLNAVLKSRRSRLTEICIGILGNMACHDGVCVEMMKNNDFVNIIMAFLEDPDTPILVETTRLMHVCVSNTEVRHQWIDAIKTSSAIKHFKFILENSLNVDLLTNCSHLVEKILDNCDDLIEAWSNIDLVMAVCEAMKQTRFAKVETAEILLHILQLVSTVENGVQALVSCQSVVPLLCHFIGECGHDEGGIIVGRELSLMSSFSVLNVILMSEPLTVLNAMEKDPRIMKILMGLLGYSCKIHRKRSRYSFSEDKPKATSSKEPMSTSEDNSKSNDNGKRASSSSDVEKTTSSCGNKSTEEIPENQSRRANSRHLSQESTTSTISDEGYTTLDVHHQYFTVAIDFLKDIISGSSVAPTCVSNMVAPHQMMLQKIVHYSKRIDTYRDVVEDLVEATLSNPDLTTLHDSLTQNTSNNHK